MGRIIFKNIIVHLLDNKGNNIKLSDYELDNYEKIEVQLVKHIQRSINHDNRKIALFKGNKNIVRDSCINIFQDENSFISESQNMANHLFSCMTGNASPANLIVCRYIEDGVRYIALLKMDFNEIFTPTENEVNGKLKIDLKLIDNSLPSKNEKLQKCVFISENILSDNDDEYFLLLDKQRGKDVSEFFSKAFLNCELKNSDKQNSGNFIREFMSVINEEYVHDSTEKIRIIKKFKDILLSLNNDEITVPNIIGEIFTDGDLRNSILEKIGEKQNFDFEFRINSEYVRTRFKKLKYVTNSGITILGEEEMFDDRDKFEILDNRDNGTVDILIKDVKYDIEVN